jgi:hypothetical protein
MESAMLSKRRRVGVISEPPVTAGEPVSINDFPDEVMLKILSYFGPAELCFIIGAVCDRWNALSKDVTLWKRLSYSCYGTSDINRIEQVRCAALLGFRANVSLLIMAEVSGKCLSTIWLVTDPCILFTVHTTSMFLLSAPLCTHAALLDRLLYTVA